MKTFTFIFNFDYYTSPQSYFKKKHCTNSYIYYGVRFNAQYIATLHMFLLSIITRKGLIFFFGKIVFSYDSISIINLYEGKSVSSYFYCIIQLLIIPYKKTNLGHGGFLGF